MTGVPEDPDQAAMDHLQDAVLLPGEQLVWRGRPDPKRVMVRNLGAGVFGVIFMGFAGFWIAMASSSGSPLAAFGIPFFLIGGFLASKPWRMRVKAQKSYYAITDQRVIILSGGRRGYQTEILNPADITDLKAKPRAGDSGDLQLRMSLRNAPGRGHRNLRRPRKIRVVAFQDALWGIKDLSAAEAAVSHLIKQGVAS